MRLADRQDGIEVVVESIAGNGAAAFHSNCSEIPKSSISLKFRGLINGVQVLVDGGSLDPEQLRHLFLGDPDAFGFHPHIDGKAALGREDGEVRVGRNVVDHEAMVPLSRQAGKPVAYECSTKIERDIRSGSTAEKGSR